jgi:hypothetical protein
VIWAAALEAERPRRGTPVFVLLALAGLMRPEAWLLSGLYFLWTFLPATWPERVRFGILTWLGPAVWVALDWWATGEPLFSLTHTSGLAEELGRQRTLREVPSASVEFLRELAKPPVFYAGWAASCSRHTSCPGAPGCRSRCSSRGSGRSSSWASPGCRSSTATCSCRRSWS